MYNVPGVSPGWISVPIEVGEVILVIHTIIMKTYVLYVQVQEVRLKENDINGYLKLQTKNNNNSSNKQTKKNQKRTKIQKRKQKQKDNQAVLSVIFIF